MSNCLLEGLWMPYLEKQNFDMIKNYFDISEKVVVLTGASGLIGKVIAKALSEQRCNLVAIDLHIHDDFDESESNIFTLKCNITDKSDLEAAYKKIIDKYGRIDALVNLAAIDDKFSAESEILEMTKFENYPLEMWDTSINVNLTGTFLCCQIFGKAFVKNNKGSIINVASTYGLVGPDQNLYVDNNGLQSFYKSPAYPSTKGAIANFSRYLASYWGKNNIRVNTLCPGGVKNNQQQWFIDNYSKKTCLGRMAIPDDYIGPIIFLISDASSYMTGANLIIDGGWTAI